MNISEAKKYIKDSVKIYLKKDEEGAYRIPLVRQRPVFLLGAPGIGKTAIMEQIAQELGIALVSYSMTHHTRQSALGLPFIVHKEYGGLSCDVSEYTMSEIIASVYEVMEKSGIHEGILFLDEINCVSETLAPSMLQFLQYKIFGRHQVPEGWIIVTAGNPPEYNKSVREFDVVTLDRMKILEVEADYESWREYAANRNLHTAVLNYLDMKKEDFYLVETTVSGKSYVTESGWEYLALLLVLYVVEGLSVEESLIGQYLRNDRVAREFSAYYDLYRKYQQDYRVEDIFAGTVSEQVKDRARKAAFDERLSLMGMLLDRLRQELRENGAQAKRLKDLMNPLRALKQKAEAGEDAKELAALLQKQADAREQAMDSLAGAGALSIDERQTGKVIVRFLREGARAILTEGMQDGQEAFALVKARFDEQVEAHKADTGRKQERLHGLFSFVEDTFGEGNEMLLLVTECTVQADCAAFINTYGCEDYVRHNEGLMLTERGDVLAEEIRSLDL